MNKIKWYCDECNAFLNKQPGFTLRLGIWKCKKCGYINNVEECDILTDEEYKKFKKSGCSNYNDFIMTEDNYKG